MAYYELTKTVNYNKLTGLIVQLFFIYYTVILIHTFPFWVGAFLRGMLNQSFTVWEYTDLTKYSDFMWKEGWDS